MFNNALAAFLTIFALSGCSDSCIDAHSVDVKEVTWIEVKMVPGGGDSETAIANSRHAQVAEWLDANRCGWKKYHVTLPAPDFIVGGADFALYVQKNSVFLGQRGETMLVKSLTDTEAQRFREILFASDR